MELELGYDNHIKTAWILTHLGNVYGKMGQNEKARDILKQSVIIYQKHFRKNHLEFIWILGCLENIYQELGEYKKVKTFNN